MGQVNTVRGPIDAEALGATLMHEHVFVRSPEVATNWPTGWDRATQVARAVERLQELKEAGIDTIVDLTVVGLGRDIEPVQEVAAQVDLNIVVATGLYTYNELPHYFDYRGAPFRPSGVDMLDEFFLHDIENGIAGFGGAARHPEVRHRQAGAHARSRAHPSCRGPRPPPQRAPDLHPHRHPHAPRARPATRLRR